jgi:hypothetical protein
MEVESSYTVCNLGLLGIFNKKDELLKMVDLGHRSVDCSAECERYFTASCYIRQSNFSPAEIVAGTLEELGERLLRRECVNTLLGVEEGKVLAFRRAVQEFLVTGGSASE